MKLIDIHTHNESPNTHLEIINLDLKNILSEKPGFQTTFSVGLHPWDIDKADARTAFEQVQKLAKKKNCLAIGETGLDLSIDTDLELQKEFFEKHIKLAMKFDNKPIMIHCVRAYNEILFSLKKHSFTGTVIFHDYNGNEQITKQLLNNNSIYFSYGQKLFRPQTKAYKSLALIPPQRLFFETDDETLEIREVYERFCQIRSLDLIQVTSQTYRNFKKVFKNI